MRSLESAEIANKIFSLGFAVPALVGGLTHGVPGLAPWHTVFYITAGLLGLEFVIFTFFASADEQPWNQPKKVSHANEELKKLSTMEA